MDQAELESKLKRLKVLLREVPALLPLFREGQKDKSLDRIFSEICDILFSDDFDLFVWDEGEKN